ncbi:MAG: O-antigen ligase family protein [Clostridia bacterium]|nr:O-antigen ligase family protein [Clostridia bacterium]
MMRIRIDKNNEIIKKITAILLLALPFVGLFTLIGRFLKLINVLMLLVTFAMMSILFLLNFDKFNKKMLIVLALNAASVVVTGIFYSSWGSIVQFLNLLLMMVVFNNMSVTQKIYRILHVTVTVTLSLYLFTMKVVNHNLSMIFDLFGNNINSNTVSILYLAAAFHLVCFIETLNVSERVNIIFKVLCLAIYGYKIYEFASRSALISLVLFIALIFIFKKPFSYKVLRRIVIAALVFSLLFAVVYVGLYSVLGNFKILGKSLFSGRQIIWSSAFYLIMAYPIFGCGNSILFQTIESRFTSSSHHMLIGVWKILGIIPMLTTILCFINKFKDDIEGRELTTPQMAFISVLPICFFESFYTDSYLYIYFILFLLRYVKKEEK